MTASTSAISPSTISERARVGLGLPFDVPGVGRVYMGSEHRYGVPYGPLNGQQWTIDRRYAHGEYVYTLTWSDGPNVRA